jgi:hypothetical protein
MKKQHNIGKAALCAALLLNCGALLLADDSDVFINPGPPQVHPSDSVTPTSFDHMVPTTYPITVVTPPDVHPTDVEPVHPTDQPLVPTGPQ